MTAILDANVLLRFTETGSVQHPVTVSALSILETRGESLRTLPQCLYEFWVVATRPVANNGLGLSTADAEIELTWFEGSFPPIYDPPSLYTDWKSLVVAHDCKGKVAHDARIVAAMQAHGLAHILTFNVADSARYPGLTVLDPDAIAASAAP
jgi:predicted nucleic acid-binding protein